MGDQFSKRDLILISLVGLTIVLVQFIYSLGQRGDKFVMCDVGQGDGMYIRIDKIDIVIDAGRGNLMAKCLGRYLPILDKTIDLIFVTNSDVDHFGGIRYLYNHYRIKKVLVPAIADKDLLYVKLLDRLIKSGVNVDFIYAGDDIQIGKKATFSILWPTKSFIDLDTSTCAGRKWPKISGLHISCSKINPFSEVFIFDYNSEFAIVFTGDITGEALKNYINIELKDYVRNNTIPIVLKIPHHGSRTGLTEETMQVVRPSLSLISAGRNNRYNHPHKQVLQLLDKYKSPYLITSTAGDVQIDLDSMIVRPELGRIIKL